MNIQDLKELIEILVLLESKKDKTTPPTNQTEPSALSTTPQPEKTGLGIKCSTKPHYGGFTIVGQEVESEPPKVSSKCAQELESYLKDPVTQANNENLNTLGKQRPHPMLGKRCLVRTYSAGVHIGDVEYIEGMEAKLTNALRLWSWKDGGLSLSAIANNGVVTARLNYTGEVYLTNVIELIPTTAKAEETYKKFIEDYEFQPEEEA